LNRVIEYEKSFSEVIEMVVSSMARFFAKPGKSQLHFDHLEESVYIKNAERVITFANKAYRETFTFGKTPEGKNPDSFLQETIARTSIQTDRLLFSGVSKIEFEHEGFGTDQGKYRFVTYKHSYVSENYEPYAILGITRPIERLPETNKQAAADVLHSFKVYSEFPHTDKQICRYLAAGLTSKEISEALSLTQRAIEIKRKKILQQFGFEKPVEVVVVMTRFHERKLIE